MSVSYHPRPSSLRPRTISHYVPGYLAWSKNLVNICWMNHEVLEYTFSVIYLLMLLANISPKRLLWETMSSSKNSDLTQTSKWKLPALYTYLRSDLYSCFYPDWWLFFVNADTQRLPLSAKLHTRSLITLRGEIKGELSTESTTFHMIYCSASWF